MELNNDGSMKGRTFSGDNYKGEHPTPKHDETYKEYRERVNQCRDKGFHLGDLSWQDWESYCIGAGYHESISEHDKIL